MSDEKKTNTEPEKINTFENGEALEKDTEKDFDEPVKGE